MYIDKSTSGTDCADILKRYPILRGKDGVYNTIYDSDKMKAVYCDMTTDNGGWTVISLSSSLSFFLYELSIYRFHYNDSKSLIDDLILGIMNLSI